MDEIYEKYHSALFKNSQLEKKVERLENALMSRSEVSRSLIQELHSCREEFSRRNEELKNISALSRQEAEHFKARVKTLFIVFYFSLYLLFVSVSCLLMVNDILVAEWVAPLVFGPYCFYWMFTIASDWKKGFCKKHKFDFYFSLLLVVCAFLRAIIGQFFV